MELWEHGAIELAAAIERGEVSAREAVQAHLQRIEKVNAQVNAVTVVLDESALAAADDADRRHASGEQLGPLHGVPITVKENIDLTGSATSQGTVALAGMNPPLDSPHVERMKAAGAIPIGRTNLPDFGLRWHTDNALRGPTRNPWDASKTPGGSSGGEAAALATGMTPLGLGNDIGGSLRIPSAFCGTAAIKPTTGRIASASSLEPLDPFLSAQLMGVQGPMARHVRDLRVGLDVMSGPHPRDPISLPVPLEGLPVGTPIRVAVVRDLAGTDPAVAAGVQAAADALADAGYVIEDVGPPRLVEAVEVWSRILLTEVNTLWAFMGPFASADANTFIDEAMEASPPTDAGGMVLAHIARHGILREWAAFFEDHPLILGPVCTQPPYEVGYDLTGVDAITDLRQRFTLTVTLNLLGLPAAAVSTGLHDGLPVGVQIAGAAFREDLCLDAAQAIEERLGVLTPVNPR
jgi:amidase